MAVPTRGGWYRGGVADRLRAAIVKGGLVVTVQMAHPKLKTDKQGNPYPPAVVSAVQFVHVWKAAGWRRVKAKGDG